MDFFFCFHGLPFPISQFVWFSVVCADNPNVSHKFGDRIIVHFLSVLSQILSLPFHFICQFEARAELNRPNGQMCSFFFPHCTPFTSSVSIENARYATNANHLENYIRFARLPVLVSSLNVPVLALIYSRIGHLNRLHIKLMTKKRYLSWHLHCLDFCIVLDLNGDELHRI